MKINRREDAHRLEKEQSEVKQKQFISKLGQSFQCFSVPHSMQLSSSSQPKPGQQHWQLFCKREAGKDQTPNISHTCTSRMQRMGEFSRANVAKNIKEATRTVLGLLSFQQSLPTPFFQASHCTLVPVDSVES